MGHPRVLGIRETHVSESRRGAPRVLRGRLALGELEASAGALLSVLLAFLAAGVAGYEAFGLERLAELGVEFHESAGDAELDRVGLAHDAAATNGAEDVEGLADIG